jgi:hypothetical protein
MSLFHGIATAVLSGREARSRRQRYGAALGCAGAEPPPHFLPPLQVLGNPYATMDGPNTAQQNFIMQLSMARRPTRRPLRLEAPAWRD